MCTVRCSGPRYLMGDNLLRSDLLVWHILREGEVVRSGPALVETDVDVGASEAALALLGAAVAIWAWFLVGPGVEGLVKL